MAKIQLTDGRTVDALALVKANLRDMLARPKDTTSAVQLRNMIYFLLEDIKDIPVRTYKQKNDPNFP